MTKQEIQDLIDEKIASGTLRCTDARGNPLVVGDMVFVPCHIRKIRGPLQPAGQFEMELEVSQNSWEPKRALVLAGNQVVWSDYPQFLGSSEHQVILSDGNIMFKEPKE